MVTTTFPHSMTGLGLGSKLSLRTSHGKRAGRRKRWGGGFGLQSNMGMYRSKRGLEPPPYIVNPCKYRTIQESACGQAIQIRK
ncbi:hypothetical protein CHS0354_027047 [Potamilus streckersoni]|uniref:Uncharacterized protein n=1 Tax=Potamilus streckersoni TaxID=2493646 RepID=A0AAE0RMG9_9BIVA|nr:hypothetical protein CHS0354_027047 [Potamilus streckersoni]